MNASRTSNKVLWWSMGRVAMKRHGLDRALEMAAQMRESGEKKLFISGAKGEPRPRVRPRPVVEE